MIGLSNSYLKSACCVSSSDDDRDFIDTKGTKMILNKNEQEVTK